VSAGFGSAGGAHVRARDRHQRRLSRRFGAALGHAREHVGQPQRIGAHRAAGVGAHGAAERRHRRRDQERAPHPPTLLGSARRRT
jgi:hypothetical protein